MFDNWKSKEDLPDDFLDLLHNRSEAIQKENGLDFEKIAEIYIETVDCLALAEICLEKKIDFELYQTAKKKLF